MANQIVVAVVGALVGGFVAYLMAIQRAQLELIVKVDEALRKDRLDAYQKLWSITGKLPLYPPETNIKFAEIEDLSKKFRHWYFEVGGIFLSEKSRDVYMATQRLLIQYAAREGIMDPYDAAGEYDEKSEYEAVRAQLSELRTQLTADIGSRRAPGLTEISNAMTQPDY